MTNIPASKNEEAKTAAVPFTETAEFKDAVAKAAQEAASQAVAAALREISAATPAAEAGGNVDLVVSQLAQKIAELTDQGTPMEQRRVAPEVLAQRQAARERMGGLIMKVRASGKKPRYRALNKIYLKEVLIEPYVRGNDGTPQEVTFTWTGVPSEYMLPLNEEAKEIFAAFCESIGSVAGKPKNDVPLWVTAGGLVIEGAAPRSLGQVEVKGLSGDDDDLSIGTGITVANDPRKKHVNILGTVAPPAEQSVVDARI